MADGSIPKTSNTLGNWKHSGLDHKVPMQCEKTQDPPSFLAVVTGTEYAYTGRTASTWSRWDASGTEDRTFRAGDIALI